MINIKQNITKIFPLSIIEKYKFVKINDVYYITLIFYDFPSEVIPFCLLDFVFSGGNVLCSQMITPLEKPSVLIAIKNRIAALSAKRHSDFSKGRLRDSSLDMEIAKLEDFSYSLISGNSKGFLMASYITLFNRNLSKLNVLSNNIQMLAESKGFTVHQLDLNHVEGFLYSLPLATYSKYPGMVYESQSLSALNFLSVGNRCDYDGILYGENVLSKALCILDIFKLENYNSVIFAKSGAGKSFLAKATIVRMISKGIKVIVIDPEGEYVKLCKSLDGKLVKFSSKFKGNNNYTINPLDLSQDESIEDKISFIEGFLKKYCTRFDKNILDKALLKLFREVNFPTFFDLYNILKDFKSIMADEIFPIAKGSLSHLYSKKTNIDINKRDNLIVFDISDLTDDNIPLMMYVILNYLWKLKDFSVKRQVFIDEAHRLFDNSELLNNLKSLTKRARKYSMGFCYITQDIGDVIDTDKGRSIIANTSLKILLKQDKINFEKLSHALSLSSEELRILTNLPIGSSLMLYNDIHTRIKHFAFEFEKKLFI